MPLLTYVPTGEEFLNASMLQDSKGVADVWVTYIRSELRTPKSSPDDATITVVWSLRRPSPIYVTPLRATAARRDPQVLQAPAVILDRTEKVEVNGHKGVMRIYIARRGGDTYPYRSPSVAINWFEGDVSWAFQSIFLSPEEALKAAESIRPVSIP